MRFPIIASILAVLFALLIDYIIYRSIPSRAWKSHGRKIYAFSAVCTILLLIIIFLLPHRDADADLNMIMWMLYTWVSIYIGKLIYVLLYAIGQLPRLSKRPAWRCCKYIGLVIAIIFFFALWWGVFFGRRNIMVTEVTISSPKLPESFNGLRIAQFSDAHVGTWGNDTTFISHLVNEINSLHPDLIVFTGDIVNRETKEIKPFISILSSLKAPMGVYSIMGNHDYGDYTDWPSEAAHKADTQWLRNIQKEMGWHLLDNDHVYLQSEAGDSIALIGVENWGEPPFKQYGNLKAAYPHNPNGMITDSLFKILLTHNPMHWHSDVRENTDIDLSLSGHTHAMQMMIGKPGKGFSPSAWRYPEWGGLYTYRTKFGTPSYLYVNIGCGEVAIPSRIGATPEITLITLKSDK